MSKIKLLLSSAFFFSLIANHVQAMNDTYDETEEVQTSSLRTIPPEILTKTIQDYDVEKDLNKVSAYFYILVSNCRAHRWSTLISRGFFNGLKGLYTVQKKYYPDNSENDDIITKNLLEGKAILRVYVKGTNGKGIETIVDEKGEKRSIPVDLPDSYHVGVVDKKTGAPLFNDRNKREGSFLDIISTRRDHGI